ncbi:hypothetical protein BDV30DRAFT_202978 [Aspergillus minisclerotigenes]|uniref:Secreted protein n=1 Tax=Aspergillus minisclerotigenes TaxID=656917 RepID=A0A5N6JKU4_9EURO|nr:hypothetical protein BDV30DRAFT_202978 [Aspergillus minisclerotigenes]
MCTASPQTFGSVRTVFLLCMFLTSRHPDVFSGYLFGYFRSFHALTLETIFVKRPKQPYQWPPCSLVYRRYPRAFSSVMGPQIHAHYLFSFISRAQILRSTDNQEDNSRFPFKAIRNPSDANTHIKSDMPIADTTRCIAHTAR